MTFHIVQSQSGDADEQDGLGKGSKQSERAPGGTTHPSPLRVSPERGAAEITSSRDLRAETLDFLMPLKLAVTA